MQDSPVTHEDLKIQTETLHREIQSGDNAILQRFNDHLSHHASEHARLEAWLLRIEGKQDQTLEAINRRLGRDAVLAFVLVIMIPVALTVMGWYISRQ